MKLDEILDPEEHKGRINTLMAQMNKQYGAPRNRPAPVDHTEHTNKQNQYRDEVGKLAGYFGPDEFEAFAAEVQKRIPGAEQYVDLQWAFDTYQPDRKQQGADAWSDYGSARQDKDPSVVGMGPTGQRNWTGD